jgi:hypothetical protein
MEVLVNGSFLGNFSISHGQSVSNLSFEGASTGPTYDIRLQALNTIPLGQSSVSLDTSGLSTVSIALVPEPGWMVLWSAGFAAMAITMRKKIRE